MNKHSQELSELLALTKEEQIALEKQKQLELNKARAAAMLGKMLANITANSVVRITNTKEVY